MKKWSAVLWLFLIMAGVHMVPSKATAQVYCLENATDFTLTSALLVPSHQGWYVVQWYTLQPYSRK